MGGGSGLFGELVGSNLAASAIAGVAGAVWNLSKAMVAAGAEAGKFAVGMFSLKETTLASLKVMLGSEAAAADMFAEMLRFAKKTPFETQDVIAGYTSMLGAGFSKDQAGKVFSALGDVSSMSGFDKEVIKKITLAFSQIKAKGRLQGEEMLQILEASGRAGVGATAVYEKIAKKLGIATGNVAKAISAGKVDSDTGILAVLEAIQDKSGGKVGNLMLEQSKTLTGLMSQLASAPGDFLLSMDLSKLQGFEAFKGFISNLVKVMDTSSDSGKLLMAVLEQLFNNIFQGLFGGLSGPEGVAKLEEVIAHVTTAVEGYAGFIRNVLRGVGGFFSGLWRNMKPALASLSNFYRNLSGNQMGDMWEGLGEVLGRILGAMMQIVVVLDYMTRPIRWMLEAVETLGTAWETMKASFSNMGEGWGLALTTGLQAGILGGMGGPVGAIAAMVGGVTTAYTVPTETHSPSGLFRNYGQWAMDGYAQGVWKNLNRAETAVADVGALGPSMVDPELAPMLGSGSASTAGGARGGTLTLSIQELHINTAYQPGAPGAQEALQADIRMALANALRELGVELGVA
jgi:tape measure domain-containing protein